MSLIYLMQYVEGPECRVDALLSNHIDGFVRHLVEAGEIQRAQEDIRANPDTRVEAILSRMDKLLHSESGATEDHPYDAAIATYLFLLSRCSASGLREAIGKLRDNPRDDMPWTAMMCSWVLRHREPAATFSDTNGIQGEFSFSADLESAAGDSGRTESGSTLHPEEDVSQHW